MNPEEARRHIDHLRKTISESEAAISALQRAINLADHRIKDLEEDTSRFEAPPRGIRPEAEEVETAGRLYRRQKQKQ